jgi:hypothetical protein
VEKLGSSNPQRISSAGERELARLRGYAEEAWDDDENEND